MSTSDDVTWKGPVYPYGRMEKPGNAFVAVDKDHVPYTRRPGDVDYCRCECRMDMNADGSIYVMLEETVRAKMEGRSTSKVLTFTVPREMADAIRSYRWQLP